MAGAGVWLGGYLADIPGNNVKLYVASLAAGLVCGAGNALNDFVDIEADRLNHPGRPLPKGDLPLYMAILIAIIFNLASVVLALFVNGTVLIAVILSIIILFAYNLSLKKVPLWGNLSISILGAAAFIVGGFVRSFETVLMIPGPIIPAAFAFLFHLGREFVKDVADYEGDRTAGHRTLPALLSPDVVLVLTSILYAVLIVLTLLPVYFEWYHPAYAFVVVILLDIPLIILLIYLWVAGSKRRFALGGSILKLLMVFGLLAFLFGKI